MSPIQSPGRNALRDRRSIRCISAVAAARARASPRRLAALLAAGAALCSCPDASATAPPFGTEPDPDPLDVLVDGALGERTTQEPRAGSLAVGIEAMLRVSSLDRTSFGAFAFVQLPLARLGAPPRRALARLPAPEPVEGLIYPPVMQPPGVASSSFADSAAVHAVPPFAGAASALLPRALAEPPRATPPLPEPAPDAEPAGSASTPAPLLSPELARGAVWAACKAAKLDAAEARLDSLASRAKSSALLPELRLRATRAIDESQTLSPTEYDPLRRTASGGTNTWFEARATFRLDRLVFADDELAVERLRISRAAERSKLVAKVLELLDAWQRARATEADATAKPDARLRATLAAAASEASLDVLSGGWFSKAIAERREVAGPPVVAPAEPLEARADGARAERNTASATGATVRDPGATSGANNRTRDANERPHRAAAQDHAAADMSLDTSRDAAQPSPPERGAPRKK